LIVSSFSPKHGHCSLTIESADDLWVLRRLIRKGDVVVTRSSRVVKLEDEFSRPDKGERVKVTVALQVEEIHLDSSIERLRLRGFIRESSDESVTKAGFHSLTLSPGYSLTLRKVKWRELDTRLVESSRRSSKRFVLVAIDRREAGVGSLAGSHLSIIATIDSGAGGKMVQESSSQQFMRKVSDLVRGAAKDQDIIVLAGPGHTKNVLANMLSLNTQLSGRVRVVDGLDIAGADGVRSLVKLPSFQKLAADTTLVEIQRLVSESVRRIAAGESNVAYTLPRVLEAARAGAVESCAVSDNVFSLVDEEQLVETLDEVESRGGKVYMADSTLEFGKQVSSLGGIVALLRYRLTAY
jgi:protein pelota